MPIPKPKWINVKKEDLTYGGVYRAETSAADRQGFERRKEFRTWDVTSNDEDATEGITDSNVLTWGKKCNQFKVSFVKKVLEVTTSFLIKSKRYAKKEAMESGLYVLRNSVQSRLEPNPFHLIRIPIFYNLLPQMRFFYSRKRMVTP